ncbi:hypothetical protein NEIRO03_0855 [Nematocida sp. AWRm78]|nr:hypothetical protein NEIRO02_1120 [Nematocida sp. AWRm79]KAI5183240.1 hypothetical protein NEIRO03_0855 [Nematocida sp. AWRm78]
MKRNINNITIIGALAIKAGIVSGSVAVTNGTSTAASVPSTSNQPWNGTADSLHNINKSIAEQQENLGYSENILKSAIEKYGNNETETAEDMDDEKEDHIQTDLSLPQEYDDNEEEEDINEADLFLSEYEEEDINETEILPIEDEVSDNASIPQAAIDGVNTQKPASVLSTTTNAGTSQSSSVQTEAPSAIDLVQAEDIQKNSKPEKTTEKAEVPTTEKAETVETAETTNINKSIENTEVPTTENAETAETVEAIGNTNINKSTENTEVPTTEKVEKAETAETTNINKSTEKAGNIQEFTDYIEESDWKRLENYKKSLTVNKKALDDLKETYRSKYSEYTNHELDADIKSIRKDTTETYCDIYKLISTGEVSNCLAGNNKPVNYKLKDFPTLTPHVNMYYSSIVDDLKNLIKLSQNKTSRISNGSEQTDSSVDQELLAKNFISLIESPYVFKQFTFNSDVSNTDPTAYVENRLSMGILKNQVSSLTKELEADRLTIRKYFANLFTQIELFMDSHGKFNSCIDNISKNPSKLLSDSESSFTDSQNVGTQCFYGWKASTNSFIKQSKGLLKLIENISKSSSKNSSPLMRYIKYYSDEYIDIRGEYFTKLKDLIFIIQERINTITPQGITQKKLSLINSSVQYISNQLLNLIYSINMGLGTDLQSHIHEDLDVAKKRLVKDVTRIFKVSTLIKDHINLPSEITDVSKVSYTEELVQQLTEDSTSSSGASMLSPVTSLVNKGVGALITLAVHLLRKASLFR